MRTITPELEALLRARFQAAGSGYAARIEVDTPVAPSGVGVIQTYVDASLGSTIAPGWDSPPVAGDLLLSLLSQREAGSSANKPAGWTYLGGAVDGYLGGSGIIAAYRVATATANDSAGWGALGGTSQPVDISVEVSGYDGPPSAPVTASGTDDTTMTLAGITLPGPGLLVVAFQIHNFDIPPHVLTPPAELDELYSGPRGSGGGNDYVSLGTVTVDAAGTLDLTWTGSNTFFDWGWCAMAVFIAGQTGSVTVASYRPKRINLNKNLRMGPDQAEIELANEDLALGYGPTSIFPTNSRCRAYQWFGDPANEVLTFTGIIDKIADSRDPLTTQLTCRSLAGTILVDQTFSTTAPQEAGETGAVRTEANGVYLNREVDYIALDIIDGAGWPSGDIDVAATSFVLDEFIREDGETGWDTLARLTAFVGYGLWDDEDGVIHFRPVADQPGVGEPLDPDYAYEIGIGL